MSSDEIRKLAQLPSVQFGGYYSPAEKNMIRATLLAYAAMVERCEKLKAQCVKICGKNECDNKGSKCIQCAYPVIDFIAKGEK